MIRSRFLFLLLLLAYICLTPAGVYTCACFVTGEPAKPVSSAFDQFPEHVPAGHTAVCSLLAYFSLTFLMAAGLNLAMSLRRCWVCLWPCKQPTEFIPSPPTPPPHFA